MLVIQPPTVDTSVVGFRESLQARWLRKREQNLPAEKVGAGLLCTFVNGVFRTSQIVTFGGQNIVSGLFAVVPQ